MDIYALGRGGVKDDLSSNKRFGPVEKSWTEFLMHEIWFHYFRRIENISILYSQMEFDLSVPMSF